ncbi:unnamed protein product [Amoebophrya sp. A120]|nr:unnamed protein product [Amoebophrya sp. A120]|eukprot:GSA120T00020493001.1
MKEFLLQRTLQSRKSDIRKQEQHLADSAAVADEIGRGSCSSSSTAASACTGTARAGRGMKNSSAESSSSASSATGETSLHMSAGTAPSPRSSPPTRADHVGQQEEGPSKQQAVLHTVETTRVENRLLEVEEIYARMIADG